MITSVVGRLIHLCFIPKKIWEKGSHNIHDGVQQNHPINNIVNNYSNWGGGGGWIKHVSYNYVALSELKRSVSDILCTHNIKLQLSKKQTEKHNYLQTI